jgi:hypothetical protein
MQPSTIYRYAFTVSVAAALLAGCGGSQPPIGAPDAMLPQSAPAIAHAPVPSSSSNGYKVLYSFNRTV